LDLDKQMRQQVGLLPSSGSSCSATSSPTHAHTPTGGGNASSPSSMSGGSKGGRAAASEPALRFCVKFYTPDPAQIEEEYTRYLFCLQVKRDLALGALQCNDSTAALMASYIVQGTWPEYAIRLLHRQARLSAR
jgi:hypothetical protein